MTGISPTGAATSLYTTNANGTAAKNELGKDAFLNLLVAQLKYQDPSKPTDSSQFMAQTAQFTLVEKMEALATAQTETLNSSRLQAATALVGRSITWTEGEATKTGTVTAVAVANGTPKLLVGSTEVALDTVTKVQPAGTR